MINSRSISTASAVALVVVVMVLLGTSVVLPIGPSYWDLFMYLDGSYRIGNDQVPHRDFFLPFGPLGLYLFHWCKALLPGANNVLAAGLPALLLALPLMLDTAARVQSRVVCALLWACFAAVALLPVNFLSFPEPFAGLGSSAFGIYNRQAGVLLFVVIAALFHPSGARRSALLVAMTLAFLAFIKITAFAAVLPLVLWAMLTRRIHVPALLGGAGACALVLAVVELQLGLVSGYLHDLQDMAEAGARSPLRRLVEFSMRETGPLALLFVMTAATGLAALDPQQPRSLRTILHAHQGLFPGLAIAVCGALLAESQNTGSLTWAFLLPAALAVPFPGHAGLASRTAAIAAAGFACLMLVQLVDRTTRILLGMRQPVVAELQGSPMAVRANAWDQDTANRWLDFYASGGPGVDELLHGSLAGSAGYGAIYRMDEHLAYLLLLSRLPAEFSEFERRSGLPVATVASLDFVDPAPMVLQRPPVRELGVVFDPDRMLSARQRTRLLRALATTDVIIENHCNAWRHYGAAYRTLAGPVLAGRKTREIGKCWRAHIKPDLLPQPSRPAPPA